MPRQRHPVAIFEIGDAVREWRERHGVAADEHLAFAMADREWCTLACSDQKIRLVAKHDRQRKCAFEPR
jgi:hypothetical protein